MDNLSNLIPFIAGFILLVMSQIIFSMGEEMMSSKTSYTLGLVTLLIGIMVFIYGFFRVMGKE